MLKEVSILDFGAAAQADNNAAAIQAAIDACEGGGIVIVPAGTYKSAALRLKNGVTLRLEKGAVLEGSADFRDYDIGAIPGWREQPSPWFNSLLGAQDAQGIIIEGEGTIDGADCNNPGGEEGFRGPHAVCLFRCSGVRIQGVHIRRAANYAMLLIESENVAIRDVAVRGGHDGVHAQRCRNFVIDRCDFRTGDDCIAGSDNRNFAVNECVLNTSCNGFRLGCRELSVESCRFFGPGESPHLVSRRHNMLCAFVHFAPPDRKTRLPSDNWHIKGVTVDNVEALYSENHKDGLWQTGQPALSLLFENIRATNVAQPVNLLDSAPRKTRLRIVNSHIALKSDVANQSVLTADGFDSVELCGVELVSDGSLPAIDARDGNRLELADVRLSGGIKIDNVDSVSTK